MKIKQAMQQLIDSHQVPEEEIIQIFHAQDVDESNSRWLNILFFFLGATLLCYGIIRTYEFTSQADPHGAVQEKIDRLTK